MIAKLLRKLFYNPARHAQKLKFMTVGEDSLLLPNACLDFRLGEKSFAGNINIGKRTMLACNLVFESNAGNLQIGNDTFINGGTQLICRDSISIGSNVTIAWGCALSDHNSHSLDWRNRMADLQQQFADVRAGRNFIHRKDWSTVTSRGIIIEDKVWLGFGVIVLNGVRIGEGAIVGAGSVVRSDVPAWTVVCGNPAVFVKNVKPA
ncbi:MAG: acyltransferase [Arenimonas sp.]